ncbi:MAG: hypothetical protein Q8909_06175 [Bacteroidota bacterium]|nr:hypothetical protein [Bacteroidota bacterium]
MKSSKLILTIAILTTIFTIQTIYSQQSYNPLTTGRYGDGPDSIAPVGVLKNLTDDQLLETVQRQTFIRQSGQATIPPVTNIC